VSDLVVIGYPDERTAGRAWGELTRLQQGYLADLEDAAIVRRDHKGKLRITSPAHHAVAWGTLSGLFWGTVIGLLLLPVAPVAVPLAPMLGAASGLAGAGIGAGADLLFEDDFRRYVQDLLQPGTAALLIILRGGEPGRFMEALRPYGGTILKTSLPPGAEDQLMKVLHGADPKATTWEQPEASAAASSPS
jgi:uncharacterized membrane protein